MALGVPPTAGHGKADPDESLVRLCDLAGRPRGTGFLIDTAGTLLTSHEAVDGLRRLVLHARSSPSTALGGGASGHDDHRAEQTCLVEAEAITPLPEQGLALVATEGLVVPPLPVAESGPADPDGWVRLHADSWVHAAVAATVPATYTATDRFHLLGEVYELVSGTPDALRGGPLVSGSPLVDTRTGAVLGVVATAVHAAHAATGFAIPLRAEGPLAEPLARNAATVPAYGAHLNLAGALQLTATSVGSAGAGRPRDLREPEHRPAVEAELRNFLDATDERGPRVLGLVGDPGCGRTTELGALAARRARGARPAPTVWLRGAELRPGDGGLKEAVERALRGAGRIIDASGGIGEAGQAEGVTPDAVAHLARAAGRPLLVLLDAPEEMPPVLAHALPDWTAGTTSWLRAAGVRLVVACRPEYWERAGALFPAELLYRPEAPGTVPDGPARALPACVRLGDLTPEQAERARERYGIPDGAIDPADAAHPLALRLLAEVRAANPDVAGAPDRPAIFSAYLDLVCLRIAVRLAVAGSEQLAGTAVRRLAARVAGQVHEAARQCLGPGQGELDRETFEEIFPWRSGWASAVLTEGLLVPAGAGYRFAHEEFGDWLQAGHLDLDAALHALVHRWQTAPPGHQEAPVRLPSRPVTTVRTGTHDDRLPPPPPAPSVAPTHPPHALPVPRHRIGPVVQALLLAGRRDGTAELAHRLDDLVGALDAGAARPTRLVTDGEPPERADGGGTDSCDERRADAAWWAAHLLGEVLLSVADAAPFRDVLRRLAERITVRSLQRGGFSASRLPAGLADFGPWFWLRLPLDTADRLDLLRLLLPADGPPPAKGRGASEERFLTAAGELLCADTDVALPLICGWFDDDRPLPAAPGPGRTPTVASAAQALLHTHRHRAVDSLTEALVAAAHPRADELLAALAEDEPSAMCRAVDRWAHEDRPERHVAAAAYGLRAAAHVTSDADRQLLRYAALALLGRSDTCSLHGAALALLVRDPVTRNRHLERALVRFAAADPYIPASVLGTALATHPEPVLAAFQARLRESGPRAAEVLAELARVTTPALARRAAALVRGYAEHCPEGARYVADYLDLRLEQGPGARAVLFPLAVGLLRDPRAEVRRALAPVLTASGSAVSRPLRRELLQVLLEDEHDAAVLEAVRRGTA